MKIKEGFILRKMNNMNIVVAVGKEVKNFNGYISLNETGTFLWELLVKGITEEKLVEKLLEEYDVSQEEASKDVKAFIEKLTKEKLIEKV